MIDLDRFIRSRVTVLNEGGTRGYDQGVRTFDCPFCEDTKNRGWVGVTEFGAGCFNTGCDANPSLDGGAIEWARRVLGLVSRGETYRKLEKDFGAKTIVAQPVAPRGDDWCRLPEQMHTFDLPDFAEHDQVYWGAQSFYEKFIWRQWGLDLENASRWKLGWCASGRHGMRVVIPIVMRGHLVGFQTRTIVPGSEPKYLTSQTGPESDPHAECGRPAAALLFNFDALRPGEDGLLVEGAGDVMGWHARRGFQVMPAVGNLGTALTPQKLDLLAAARLGRLVVALDPEPAAQARARLYLADLLSWGIPAVLGAWQGAKDAGAGADLVYDATGQKGGYDRIQILKTLRGEV